MILFLFAKKILDSLPKRCYNEPEVKTICTVQAHTMESGAIPGESVTVKPSMRGKDKSDT